MKKITFMLMMFAISSTAFSQTTVTCGATTNQSGDCYVSGANLDYSYTSSDPAQVLNITVNAGEVEENWDEFIVYDGADDTAAELYNGYGTAGDLTGLSITTTGPDMYVRIQADGSNDCVDQMYTALDFDVTCTAPLVAPNCAETPITPMDGATDLPAFEDVVISWTPPSTGPVPTSYDLYVGTMSDGSDQGLFVNTTDTSASAPIGAYDTTIYWSVVPKNGALDAVGCQTTLYSFTSGSAPAPPANDDVCNAIPITVDGGPESGTDESATEQTGEVVGSCFNGGINGSVWYSFVAPTSGDVRVTTDYVGGGSHDDTEIAVYAAPTDCNDASTLGAEAACNQDDGDVGDGFLSQADITDLNPGETYYIQVDRWGTANPGSFQIGVFDLETLSIGQDELTESLKFYPNPVNDILTLKAQQNVESVSVFNIAGQRVLESTPNTQNVDLDMSELQTGAYFVRVQMTNGSKTIKIMKQ